MKTKLLLLIVLTSQLGRGDSYRDSYYVRAHARSWSRHSHRAHACCLWNKWSPGLANFHTSACDDCKCLSCTKGFTPHGERYLGV